MREIETRAEDQREWSQAQDAISHLKDCSNRVIDAAIKELEYEKIERNKARTQDAVDQRA